MVQAESLMSPPLRGRMRDGAVPQSKPATPRDCLTDKGRQTLFRRNFLSRISDVGLGIAERLLGITSSLPCCRSSLAGQTEGCGSRQHWAPVCVPQDMIHRGAGLPQSWGSGFSPDNATPPHPSQHLGTSESCGACQRLRGLP